MYGNESCGAAPGRTAETHNVLESEQVTSDILEAISKIKRQYAGYVARISDNR